MHINFASHCSEANAKAKAFFLFEDQKEALKAPLSELVNAVLDRGSFSFTPGCAKLFELEGRQAIVVSVGKASNKASSYDLRLAAKALFDLVRKEKIAAIKVELFDSCLDKTDAYRILAEQAQASLYVYDRYKSSHKAPVFESCTLLNAAPTKEDEAALKEGQILAEAITTTRFLIDEPANKLGPEELAAHVQALGQKTGFDVEVFEQAAIEALGMHAYLEVARAAAKPPRLIVMRYKGDPGSETIYGLVGKGLCYDSGGYSIKPSKGMEDMKTDMGGAGTVIGAMEAIAKAKLKVNVTAVVAACMNMIGPDGYLPGDIISSMAGKSIYVGNTDAEGRLTLVDAITYIIRKEKVSTVFDYATLTGAVLVCLGSACAAGLTNDQSLYDAYAKAAKASDEKVWQLPIYDEYRELVKHSDADLNNSAGHPGTITAAVFLENFVEDTPWIHFDIAGTASVDKPFGLYAKGATGYAVRSIYTFMKDKQ